MVGWKEEMAWVREGCEGRRMEKEVGSEEEEEEGCQREGRKKWKIFVETRKVEKGEQVYRESVVE